VVGDWMAWLEVGAGVHAVADAGRVSSARRCRWRMEYATGGVHEVSSATFSPTLVLHRGFGLGGSPALINE